MENKTKKKKKSYLSRKKEELGKRYRNKRYERLKKSVGTDAMGNRIQKLLSDFDLYREKFHKRLDEKRQKGGKTKKRRKINKKRKKKRKTKKI